MPQPVLIALAIIFPLCLAGLIIFQLNGAPARRRADGKAAAIQDQVEAFARQEGWQVTRGEEAARREFVPSLEAKLVEVGRCDLVIAGPDWVAESWAMKSRNLGSPVGFPVRQHILRLPLTGVPSVALGPLPKPRGSSFSSNSSLMPRRWRNNMGIDIQRMWTLGGDLPTLERLAPMIAQVHASGLWVIVDDGHLTVMSNDEPDPAELQRRLQLARGVIATLA